MKSNEVHFQCKVGEMTYSFSLNSIGGTPTGQEAAVHALRLSGISTDRHNPEKQNIYVSIVALKNGALTISPESRYSLTPPFKDINQEEFVAESIRLLSEIPKEFCPYLSAMAYERGHSAGFEEVLLILKNEIVEIAPAIKDFEARINREH